MIDGPRAIPSIDRLMQRPGISALESRYGRRAVIDAVRAEADALRTVIAQGSPSGDPGAMVEAGATRRLAGLFQPSLRRVINATGVVIHTNLGRAPLSEAAAAQVARLASGYCNLEYDLDAGSRGRRDLHAEVVICRLTGADAACVVNNNAAATLLTLAALAAGREVIVSRGELVEIGGGFRVPDVMAQSGAVLREVGTTNRTRTSDYAAAISERTAAILRVHPSNFKIEGFTQRPAVGDLADLGRRFNIPVLDDLGSGYLGNDAGAASDALRDEPAVASTLSAGANIVMFSGDKLLGGPQAGIIAGRGDLVETIRRHPLMRALRVDKMTYAALETTLQDHLAGKIEDVPVARMIAATAAEIGARADRLAAALEGTTIRGTVVDGFSTIGGGSAPGSTLPTRLLQLRHHQLSAHALEARLRTLDVPVIARIEQDVVVLDLRTVLPADDEFVLHGLHG
ncbi:MAG: L-seryl-tRNA(Sec) selenium transferase [Acidobacteriota bacterium]|nr:L-seryl-tRNA(Sec) selenium transferase [Acidobacteriota bacterium]